MSWMYFNTQSHSASYYNTGPYARVLLVFIFLDTPDEICFLFLTSMAHSWHTHDSFVSYPWLIRFIPMTHSWHTHDSFVTYPWLIRDIPMTHLEHSWLLHDIYKSCVTHCWLMTHARLICDSCVIRARNVHDSFVSWLISHSWIGLIRMRRTHFFWRSTMGLILDLCPKHNSFVTRAWPLCGTCMTHSWRMPCAGQ